MSLTAASLSSSGGVSSLAYRSIVTLAAASCRVTIPRYGPVGLPVTVIRSASESWDSVIVTAISKQTPQSWPLRICPFWPQSVVCRIVNANLNQRPAIPGISRRRVTSSLSLNSDSQIFAIGLRVVARNLRYDSLAPPPLILAPPIHSRRNWRKCRIECLFLVWRCFPADRIPTGPAHSLF